MLGSCDLQAVKAAGITFANSMIERIIEERAGDDATKANTIRSVLPQKLSGNLSSVIPGSVQIKKVLAYLQKEGM